MKLLNLKYKMHKLVNLVFYLIIFGIGFLLGFGAEKINFNKLISEFLFIDNVSAYTIQVGNNTIDEQYIYDTFSTISDFNLKDYSTIECISYFDYYYRTILNCNALPTDFFEKATFREKDSYDYIYDYPTNHTQFNFVLVDKELTKYKNVGNSFFFKHYMIQTYDLKRFSNFDYPHYDNNSSYNVLDFSNFMPSSGDNENTGGDNENTGGDNDNTDEDIEIEVVNSGFYEFAQKIFGEVSEENKFIYDFITFGLVVTCFTLFVLVVGYIFNKFFGG